LAGFDLVVTTYGLVRRQPWLEGVSWSLVILDEAQAIKNAASVQTRSVKTLPANSRLVLTGTPVENHLGDLWSLFDFCCPGLLAATANSRSLSSGSISDKTLKPTARSVGWCALTSCGE